eukprot:CAMPEP_0172364250 /NCGR_PEP_ID=MMETSP1060-20121228/7427_1 /TAXON_ID=37318 /ORGANISM="Pseudo-nitzschia pungens, Strain cf. cingulata" /LENGTH=44 /DNA_ID= /DNA_START= /DNA_END= /DNA_ORIENTATION=
MSDRVKDKFSYGRNDKEIENEMRPSVVSELVACSLARKEIQCDR